MKNLKKKSEEIVIASHRLKSIMLDAVDNQLRDNNPKVTTETFEQLTKSGHNKQTAKEMIAAVFLEEIYDIMKFNRLFDQDAYSRKLKQLVSNTSKKN